MNRPAAAWIALAALLLLASPSPVRADGVGSIPLETVRYSGAFQGLAPGGVMVGMPGGPSVLLPQGLSFTVGGQRVDLGGYSIGSPLDVLIPACTGQVMGYNGDLLAVMLPTGAAQIPLSLVSPGVQSRTKVQVLKKNGKVVTVPLNAALNMQRAQGAVILGNAPVWTSGLTGPAVVVGPQGDHVLLSVIVDGTPRFYRAPRSKAGKLGAPGTPFHLAPGYVVGDWNPGKGHGKASSPPGQSKDKGKPDSPGNGNGGGGKGKGKGKNK